MSGYIQFLKKKYQRVEYIYKQCLEYTHLLSCIKYLLIILLFENVNRMFNVIIVQLVIDLNIFKPKQIY